jgi:Helix-turn-helix domain
MAKPPDSTKLDRLARSGDRRLEERAGIVLACADSAEGNSGVAAELGLSVETVRKWRSRFTRFGTAGLADAPRPGRRKADLALTGAERDQLARWARRGKTSQVLALRAKIVLACADGRENKAVAAQLRTSEHNVEGRQFDPVPDHTSPLTSGNASCGTPVRRPLGAHSAHRASAALVCRVQAPRPSA